MLKANASGVGVRSGCVVIADESCNNRWLRTAQAMQRASQFRMMSLDNVRALIHVVEAKDPYTRRHSEQVTHYAVAIGQYIGLEGGEIATLRTAALLHDIGKVCVPDSILTKAGKLTADEFRFIYQHPIVSYEILSSISVLAAEARIVRHHHERWDGKGYPDGLAGEAIPYASRLISVADSMDAMLTSRAYKPAFTLGKVVRELRRCAGTQFDKVLAAAAIGWCRRHRDKILQVASG